MTAGASALLAVTTGVVIVSLVSWLPYTLAAAYAVEHFYPAAPSSPHWVVAAWFVLALYPLWAGALVAGAWVCYARDTKTAAAVLAIVVLVPGGLLLLAAPRIGIAARLLSWIAARRRRQ